MLYLILTLVLTILGAFTFLPTFKEAIARNSVGFNFFLTLIATLVGVLLAISITDYENQLKEKQDLIKLLNSAITAVDTCHDYSEEIIDYYARLAVDDASKPDFYENNPPPYPDYLDTFLMQDLVSKNLSGLSLKKLNENVINLKRSRVVSPQLYLYFLDQCIKLLELEVAYQAGTKSEKQLQVQHDLLKNTLTDLSQSNEPVGKLP